jgi:hypothetical protein
MIREILRRVVDPRTVRLTPDARALLHEFDANQIAIEEHRRQTNKSTMDAGQNHFFIQRDHLIAFFDLSEKQKKLARKFAGIETRALAAQLLRNIIGIKAQNTSEEVTRAN